MDRQDIAFTFLSTSIVLGLALGITVNPGLLKGFISVQEETHEHAMFFINANGTELNLKAERFQNQDKKVHLENNRSNIVHKHEEGVTWGQFLDTVEIQVNKTQSQNCLEMPKNRFCGNITVMLNGEEYSSNKEIEQGDKLAIVIGNQTKSTAEAYMELGLPRKFTKNRFTRRV